MKYYAYYTGDSFTRNTWSKIKKMDSCDKAVWEDGNNDADAHPAKRYFRVVDSGWAICAVGDTKEEVKDRMAEFDQWLDKKHAKYAAR